MIVAAENHTKINEINNAMRLCFDNGIKVYPVIKYGKLKIQVFNGTRLVTYREEFTTKTINAKMEQLYIHFANKIKK